MRGDHIYEYKVKWNINTILFWQEGDHRMKYIKFQDKNGSFSIENPENYSGLYIPLAGENGLKSAITPSLGGDSKLDQNHFLLEPVSIENLHNNRNTRNFW